MDASTLQKKFTSADHSRHSPTPHHFGELNKLSSWTVNQALKARDVKSLGQ
jgi:hypothetical protein